MAAPQSSLHTLLEAEKQALEIVRLAREDKVARLKRAKEEAELEVNLARQAKEQDFQDQIRKNSSVIDEEVVKLQAETDLIVAEVQKVAQLNHAEVEALLLNSIKTVDIGIHKNLR